MSFGPISVLGARFRHGVPVFKPSGATVSAILEILEYSSGCDPQLRIQTEGNPAALGNLAAALTLNQNPIFEIASSSRLDLGLTHKGN